MSLFWLAIAAVILCSSSRVAGQALGTITTVAGTGDFSFSGDGGSATNAQLDTPYGVAVDAIGNLFIADTDNHRIRMVAAGTGIISTVAGSGPTGFDAGGFSGDGGPATSARLNRPTGVAVDPSGNLLIADSRNNRIRKVALATGIITTIAGSGPTSLDPSDPLGGFSGDGASATSAQLNAPLDVAVDGSGNLFIADKENSRIRRVDFATGIISTVAGSGVPGFTGDGGPATSAQFNTATAVAVDRSGNLFISDTVNHRIRKVVLATGTITTVAGLGAMVFGTGRIPLFGGFSGDGGPATSAHLDSPAAVAVDPNGNLFIADRANNRIRRITLATTAPPPGIPTVTLTVNQSTYRAGVRMVVTLASRANGYPAPADLYVGVADPSGQLYFYTFQPSAGFSLDRTVARPTQAVTDTAGTVIFDMPLPAVRAGAGAWKAVFAMPSRDFTLLSPIATADFSITSTSGAPRFTSIADITDEQYESLRGFLLGSSGRLNQKWGNNNPVNATACNNPTLNQLHAGVDYGSDAPGVSFAGAPVFSATPGVVKRIERGSPCSDQDACLSTLVIFHEDTQTSFVYLHMETIVLRPVGECGVYFRGPETDGSA